MTKQDKELRKELKLLNQDIRNMTNGRIGITYKMSDLKRVLSAQELNELRELTKGKGVMDL